MFVSDFVRQAEDGNTQLCSEKGKNKNILPQNLQNSVLKDMLRQKSNEKPSLKSNVQQHQPGLSSGGSRQQPARVRVKRSGILMRTASLKCNNEAATKAVNFGHFPSSWDKLRDCIHCRVNKKERRSTLYRCEDCGENLCLPCFQGWHDFLFSQEQGGLQFLPLLPFCLFDIHNVTTIN